MTSEITVQVIKRVFTVQDNYARANFIFYLDREGEAGHKQPTVFCLVLISAMIQSL